MAKAGTRFLDTNDRFPDLTCPLVSGDQIMLPQDLGPGYAVVLFYRGHW